MDIPNHAERVEALLDRYYEEAALDGPDVVRFISDALRGAYGPVDTPVLHGFLDRLEVILLGNIETRLEETPGRGQDAAAAWEMARLELAEARDLIATLGPSASPG
jgi:hypothetical protein